MSSGQIDNAEMAMSKEDKGASIIKRPNVFPQINGPTMRETFTHNKIRGIVRICQFQSRLIIFLRLTVQSGEHFLQHGC